MPVFLRKTRRHRHRHQYLTGSRWGIFLASEWLDELFLNGRKNVYEPEPIEQLLVFVYSSGNHASNPFHRTANLADDQNRAESAITSRNEHNAPQQGVNVRSRSGDPGNSTGISKLLGELCVSPASNAWHGLLSSFQARVCKRAQRQRSDTGCLAHAVARSHRSFCAESRASGNEKRKQDVKKARGAC